MRPRSRNTDHLLHFVLQCLHSIKDENGKVRRPDYDALAPLLGLKANSLYVRYRDLVNQLIEIGVPHLQPVGTRAIEAAKAVAMSAVDASEESKLDFDSQPTPVSTPTTTTTTTEAPNATHSPGKEGGKKRKRKVVKEEQDSDDGLETKEIEALPFAKRQAIEMPSRDYKDIEDANVEMSFARPEYDNLYLDFDEATALFSGPGHIRIDDGGLSDADAEGESDHEL